MVPYKKHTHQIFSKKILRILLNIEYPEKMDLLFLKNIFSFLLYFFAPHFRCYLYIYASSVQTSSSLTTPSIIIFVLPYKMTHSLSSIYSGGLRELTSQAKTQLNNIDLICIWKKNGKCLILQNKQKKIKIIDFFATFKERMIKKL